MPDRAPPSPVGRIPVWGFPIGYNPNAMKDACERCRRTDRWQGRAIPGQDCVAWTCQCCLPRSWHGAIPD